MPKLQSGAARLDRLCDLIREVALVRPPLEKRRAVGCGGVVGMAQRACELGRCLPVRGERGGALPGTARVLEHRLPVARSLRVVGEAGEIGRARRRLGERPQPRLG